MLGRHSCRMINPSLSLHRLGALSMSNQLTQQTRWTSYACPHRNCLGPFVSEVKIIGGKLSSPAVIIAFESGGLTISCTVLYPEQFDALRRTYDCEKSMIESLARCIKWNAGGGKSGSAFLKTRGKYRDMQQTIMAHCANQTIALLQRNYPDQSCRPWKHSHQPTSTICLLQSLTTYACLNPMGLGALTKYFPAPNSPCKSVWMLQAHI